MCFLCPSNWFREKIFKKMNQRLAWRPKWAYVRVRMCCMMRAEKLHTWLEENAVSKEMTSQRWKLLSLLAAFTFTRPHSKSTLRFLHCDTGSTFDRVKYSLFPCFTSCPGSSRFFLFLYFVSLLPRGQWLEGGGCSSSFWSTMTNVHPLCYKSSLHFSAT